MMGLSFTIAAGLRQRSHSRVRVPRVSWPYFTVSDSRLPQPGGPGPRIYIPGNRVAHYKAQPVSAAQGNNRCLLWESYETQTLCGQNLESYYVKAGGTYSNHWALKS
jgi:hypothetical protein